MKQTIVFIVLVFGVAGCTWDQISNIGHDAEKSKLQVMVNDARAGAVKILENPKADAQSKEAARATLKSLDDVQIIVDQQDPSADWIEFGLTLAGALGLPFGTAAGIAWRTARNAANRNRKALEQTVTGIQSAYSTELPTGLKEALKSSQDSDVKELITEIKGK